VEIIHERAKVMEDNVRRIVHGRLREHPEDAALLNELLAALQERTQALAEVAESVDGTGLELMSATGEFLLAEEEVLPDGGDREGAET
jgi:hypothetical protein